MELQQRYYVNVNALTSQTRVMTVEAEARLRQKLGDRADAEPTIRRPLSPDRGTWFETDARPRQLDDEAQSRPRQSKTASRQDRAASRTISLVTTRTHQIACLVNNAIVNIRLLSQSDAVLWCW